MKKSAASLAYFDRQAALQDGRKAASRPATAPRSTSRYASPRKKSCITGGNCSSFGTGRSCGGHDCDGM